MFFLLIFYFAILLKIFIIIQIIIIMKVYENIRKDIYHNLTQSIF